MAVLRRRTFCRICEAHCGLIAEVEPTQKRVLRLLPDREHPVTQGYCCAKGLRLGEVHHDADRLNYPQKRTPRGFERISRQQAITEIGAKLRELVRAHGPRAIAMYRGNPSFFSFQHYLFASAFLDAIGSPNAFTSVSIDSNPKFFVATHMYGHPLLQPVADIERTELFFCLGSNPAISQMSILQLPNALGELRRITARGGRVISIDPRRTETARKVGEHSFIRPGTDVQVLDGGVRVCSEHPWKPIFDRSESSTRPCSTSWSTIEAKTDFAMLPTRKRCTGESSLCVARSATPRVMSTV